MDKKTSIALSAALLAAIGFLLLNYDVWKCLTPWHRAKTRQMAENYIAEVYGGDYAVFDTSRIYPKNEYYYGKNADDIISKLIIYNDLEICDLNDWKIDEKIKDKVNSNIRNGVKDAADRGIYVGVGIYCDCTPRQRSLLYKASKAGYKELASAINAVEADRIEVHIQNTYAKDKLDYLSNIYDVMESAKKRGYERLSFYIYKDNERYYLPEPYFELPREEYINMVADDVDFKMFYGYKELFLE